MVEAAKERLIAARQTHLDSLVDKLKEDRVRKVVLAIVNGDAPVYDDWADSLRYCRDLGIVKADRRELTFANPIYREIITRVLNSSFEGVMTGQEMFQTPFYLRPVVALDAAPAVDDALQKSHEQQLVAGLFVVEAVEPLL